MNRFSEEEMNVQLVVFSDVLDHVTRIDRVLRQPLGHLLLVGVAGAGKTVLSKFVSWRAGLTPFTIKCAKGYDVIAFENDLRTVMKRSGCRCEKITFIFDESNALGPAFLERMNALLACGEVPGLFEGDELTQLMNECRQNMKSSNVSMMEDSEIFSKFTKNVQQNLHIIFTMNPANPDFKGRGATSPALFNRCIVDWFGDWSSEALHQVAYEFTKNIPVSSPEQHQIISDNVVSIHEAVEEANQQLKKAAKKFNFIAPRDFLDFINHFRKLNEEKRVSIQEKKN